MGRCPEEAAAAQDQSKFWDSNGVHWDRHRIGWAIAGGSALITLIITIISVLGHARNYHVRDEQRQIIRILYMPAVYAIISFFSYRFFRSYTYFSLVQVVYESFTISAFLLLLIQYVASTSHNRTAEGALARKDKKSLPIPLCCMRYRPTKPKFMYILKWSVLQYAVVRPAASIAGIITQYYGVLCETEWRNPKFAQVYLEAVDFVSISVALYGLILFYGLTKEELVGRRPLAKFLSIKLIVMFTWYQGFLFSALESYGVIKATDYWTTSNIVDGLNSLTTTLEMIIFSAWMLWAFPASEYKEKSTEKTNIFRPLWDSINYSDFVREIFTSMKFFVDYIRGKPDTRARKDELEHGRVDYSKAFGLDRRASSGMTRITSDLDVVQPFVGDKNTMSLRPIGSGNHYSGRPSDV